MEWRAIPGWSAYEVSERGDIRRLVAHCGQRDRVPYEVSGGYLYIALRQPGERRGKSQAIHRLVALAFLGPPPTPLHQAAHADGDRRHNHFINLRWATRSENEMDKVRHGRSNRGERNRSARLRAAQVCEIREKLARRADQEEIAAEFGVAPSTISSIRNGYSWAWLR